MAAEYKHVEYFRRFKTSDPSARYTFTSVSDATDRLNFHADVTGTNNPTITYALADSDQTLKVTFEFEDKAKEDGWFTAVESLHSANTMWKEPTMERFKVEWLYADGSVSCTATENQN